MANDIELGSVKPVRGGAPEETDYKPVNWRKIFLTPKYIPWHIIAIVIIVFTAIVTIKHHAVVQKLRPFSEGLRDLPAGWLIPIAILFVISFPPLFGHEIVALLCGVVWGLWIGLAIVAAGTFLGEVGTWFAFMYTLRRRAEKLERTNLNYGALARLTRDGGFWIVLVIRLSAIPSHFSTAVFSTCNVKFWHFFVATFLSLPKQIFLVYLGVLLGKEKSGDVPQLVMFGLIGVVSIGLGVYMWLKMKKVKTVLLEEQNQRREKRMQEELAMQDKEFAERRMTEVEQPQASWRNPQQTSGRPQDGSPVSPLVQHNWATSRQQWGPAEPPPPPAPPGMGRAF